MDILKGTARNLCHIPGGLSLNHMDRGTKIAVVVSGFIFVIHLFSLSQSVGWFDSGEFLTTSFYLGIAHPPGEPLYLMLSKGFSLIPIGSIPFRVNLLSAVFGAISTALLLLLFRNIILRIFPDQSPEKDLLPFLLISILIAFSIGLSHPFWYQCIRTELYSMNTMLLLVVMNLAISSNWGDPYISKRLLLTSFIAGLSISLHPLTGISVIPALFIMTIVSTKSVETKKGVALFKALLSTIALISIGYLLPQIYLLTRGNLAQEMDFDSIVSISDFINFVSGAVYHRTFETIGFENFMANLTRFIPSLVSFMGLPLLIMTLFGIVISLYGAPLASSLLLSSIMVNLLSVLTQTLYSPRNPDSWGYIGLSLLLLSLIAGITPALLYSLSMRLTERRRLIPFLILMIPFTVALLFRGRDLETTIYRNSAHAEIFGREILSTLPPGAIYMCGGDSYILPVQYMRLIEGFRQDTTLFNLYKQGGKGIEIFKDRYPDIIIPDQPPSDEIAFSYAFALVNMRNRDIFASPFTPDLLLRSRLLPSRLLFKIKVDDERSHQGEEWGKTLNFWKTFIEKLEEESPVRADNQTALILSNNLRDMGNLFVENHLYKEAEILFELSVSIYPYSKNPSRHSIRRLKNKGMVVGEASISSSSGGIKEKVLHLCNLHGEGRKTTSLILSGYERAMDRDYPTALKFWKDALALNPSSPLALKGEEWVYRKGLK